MLQNCKIYDNDVGTHGLCVRETHIGFHSKAGRTDRAPLLIEGNLQHPLDLVICLP